LKKSFSVIILFTFAIISWSQKNQNSASSSGIQVKEDHLTLKPVDPQIVQDQDSMTWEDYHPIPGKDWADPSLIPERKFRIALVAVDFPDQPFVITLPLKSDLFGNPLVSPVKREDVAKFYSDFWLIPSDVNHGQTINGYWMEQSRGKFGITALVPYGPYRMPKNLWEYGLNEYNQNSFTPDGTIADGKMESDVDSLWKAAEGDIENRFDAILRIYAGYDETGVWQEFGEMKFLSKNDIPTAWGNPDTSKPRWVPTRYVPWTSWKAGQMQWGLSSIRQGENSGTITHELGHYAFDIGDNNNNPYIKPYRRAGSGPWDMMDRGCFNGPGGPHRRWVVPSIMGASMPAGLMLRNRIMNGFVTDNKVLTISRDELAKTGPVVARITARAAEPENDEFAGIIVRLDGKEPPDKTTPDDPTVNPLSSGIPDFDFYSLEVIQRIGYDSFCPDNGVLIAKNKDKEGTNGGPNGFNCFNWVIDAHPEDINKVDFIKPDGTPVMRTVADYRQLNDALFHAGNNSDSQFEWEDAANRLHFYVLDLRKNSEGILSYMIGIKSLDGPVLQKQGIDITPPSSFRMNEDTGNCTFLLKDTGGKKETDHATSEKNRSAFPDYDIYRISASIVGEGWDVKLLNSLVSIRQGHSEEVPVFISCTKGCSKSAKVIFTVRSESDPSKTTSSSFIIKGTHSKRKFQNK
jgi:M6 family metalloprotease-like protein